VWYNRCPRDMGMKGLTFLGFLNLDLFKKIILYSIYAFLKMCYSIFCVRSVCVKVICVEWDDAVYGKHEYLLRVNRKELRKINTPAVR
jgi:hypothetical protein